MSHLMTITKTTTNTTNASYVVLYTGYFKTFPGILKTLELLLGAACVGILGCYFNKSIRLGVTDLFFFLMVTAFMIGTFCNLLSCLTSLNTGTIISKTSFELIYHTIAAILLLTSSVLLIIPLSDYKRYNDYDYYMAAAIMGLVNGVLYFISAFVSRKAYRGI